MSAISLTTPEWLCGFLFKICFLSLLPTLTRTPWDHHQSQPDASSGPLHFPNLELAKPPLFVKLARLRYSITATESRRIQMEFIISPHASPPLVVLALWWDFIVLLPKGQSPFPYPFILDLNFWPPLAHEVRQVRQCAHPNLSPQEHGQLRSFSCISVILW